MNAPLLRTAVLGVVLAAPAAVLRAAEPAAPLAWPGGARAAVALTYDDGVDVQLDHVVPDLEAAGLHGTFYVPGSSESLRKRLAEWRALPARGHELGNHAIFHPCLQKRPGREWVPNEYALESYTVRRIVDEAGAMNTTLLAIDGQADRTFAYNCGDTTAGGASYVDALRPLFLSARVGEDTIVEDPRTVDLMQVPSWMVQGVTGEQMIAFVQKAVDKGGLAVFMFHGVGGGHSISVTREAHQQLLAWLAKNRATVWTDTFRAVTAHVAQARGDSSGRH